jgi:four helix bundle protein
MAPIERIEDLIAWQLARKLERLVFAFTDKAPANRDPDFCRQIRKSSSSAPNNMAEGFGRFWPGELAYKVRVAIGELEETLDQLDKALAAKYVTELHHLEMYALGDRAASAAVKFVRYLEAAGPDWKKDYSARRRAEYQSRRAARRQELQLGTPNPDGNAGVTTTANNAPDVERDNQERANQEPANQNPADLEPENQEPENQQPENQERDNVERENPKPRT